MMDEKLRQICDATNILGGKDVLLIGDFLKMKYFCTEICNNLNVTVTTNDVNCRRLMSEFDVFSLKSK